MATSPTPDPPTAQPALSGDKLDLDRWMERRRRRRRWGLRLLAFALVAAVAMTWLVWYTMHRHWMAASVLELEGLSVRWELGDGAWRRGGVSHVSTGSRAVWHPAKLTGDVMPRLADLQHVESLDLSGAIELTDDDLAILAWLRGLKRLDLSMTRPHPSFMPSPLSDAMLDRIKGLDNLEELSLAGVNITDTGLERFPSLPKLRFLDLTGTAITDRHLTLLLDRLPALDSIALERTAVTGEGVEALWRARPGLIVLHEATADYPRPIDGPTFSGD